MTNIYRVKERRSLITWWTATSRSYKQRDLTLICVKRWRRRRRLPSASMPRVTYVRPSHSRRRCRTLIDKLRSIWRWHRAWPTDVKKIALEWMADQKSH